MCIHEKTFAVFITISPTQCVIMPLTCKQLAFNQLRMRPVYTMCNILPTVQALCLIHFLTYYAHSYAGIITTGQVYMWYACVHHFTIMLSMVSY